MGNEKGIWHAKSGEGGRIDEDVTVVEEDEEGGERETRTRDRETGVRLTHLQAEVEIRAFYASYAQTRDVLLTIGAVVFSIQI